MICEKIHDIQGKGIKLNFEEIKKGQKKKA